METMVALLFAGLWSMVWHWGIGIGIAIIFAVLAYYSPIGKKFFAICALGVIFVLVGETIGIHDEKAHRDAQDKIINTAVDNAVDKAKTSKTKDRWNNPKY